MANAMAQAIGIQAAQPKRQVISMSGDGGFTMLMGDLITLTQMKLPVKVVIFNNGVLGFVALEMKAAGFVETGSTCKIPDFAAMARAMGIHAQRVEDPGDLPGASPTMLAHDGPAVLDVVTAKQELSMPPTIKRRTGQGLQSVGAARCDERPRRRGSRSRQDQSAAALSAIGLDLCVRWVWLSAVGLYRCIVWRLSLTRELARRRHQGGHTEVGTVHAMSA